MCSCSIAIIYATPLNFSRLTAHRAPHGRLLSRRGLPRLYEPYLVNLESTIMRHILVNFLVATPFGAVVTLFHAIGHEDSGSSPVARAHVEAIGSTMWGDCGPPFKY